MGHVSLRAIVVSSIVDSSIQRVFNECRSIGLSTTGIHISQVNGYLTLVILPYGSKIGWENHDIYLKKIKGIKTIMRTVNMLEWVEVAYGIDDGQGVVIDHRWRYEAEEDI